MKSLRNMKSAREWILITWKIAKTLSGKRLNRREEMREVWK